MSESTAKRNAHLLVNAHMLAMPTALDVQPAKKRLRQSSRKVSGLELRWGKEIKWTFPTARIYEQFPLPIGNGCNYYLDFLIASGGVDEPLLLLGHEVKGPYARTAGTVKLKAAARMFPWITFTLVSEVNGQWRFERIKK